MNILKELKIYVVGSNTQYANWMGGTIVHTMEQADLVVFTGGSDIHPSIYGENFIHKKTFSAPERDNMEIKAYYKALELDKFMIGICRGHQLLSALNGAKLIQDQYHPTEHIVKTYAGTEILINSFHHQAVYPFDLPDDNYSILAWSEDLSPHHHNGLHEEMNPSVEVEAIYFPETKCLGIQCHPESMGNYEKYRRAVLFFKVQLNKMLIDNLKVDARENNKLKNVVNC